MKSWIRLGREKSTIALDDPLFRENYLALVLGAHALRLSVASSEDAKERVLLHEIKAEHRAPRLKIVLMALF